MVFGLGIATVLTLIFTPSMLALRVWATTYLIWLSRLLAALSLGRASRAARDLALDRAARRTPPPEILWSENVTVGTPPTPLVSAAKTPLNAAE